MEYYIYHIPSVKIGCTTNPEKRVKTQGYTEWEILEVHTDISIASIREMELQKQYKYRIDTIPYSHSYHMQKSGASPGGKASSKNKSKEYMKSISPLGTKWNIENTGIKVIAIKKDTNEISVFDSIRQAGKVLNIQPILIRRCLINKQPYSKGYSFKYL